MISYTLCNEDNYYTIKKTLPETEGWIYALAKI